MSFSVDPTTLRALHCPACNTMYNTGQNVPCLNNACGHTLCGRCFLLKGGQDCRVKNCARKIEKATQEVLLFYYNHALFDLVSELAQRKVESRPPAGSLSAPFAKSAAPSAPPPPYGSFSPAAVPPPLFAPRADETKEARFDGRGAYKCYGSAAARAPSFSIPEPNFRTGVSQRKFLPTSTELARVALEGQGQGQFLACYTRQSLQNSQPVQMGEERQIFRLNYVDLEENPGEVLVKVSWAPSGNSAHTITIEVEKEKALVLTEQYKVDAYLDDIPVNKAPHAAFSVKGFPEYLQEGGTFWTVHFPRLYKKILGLQ